MPDAGIQQRLERAIARHRPVFGETLQIHGDTPLRAYAERLAHHPRPIDTALQNEFIREVHGLVSGLFDAPRADRIARQLRAQYVVSTADHHGPISHPFFVHANLMSASPHVDGASGHEDLIVLACSNVSLGNSSLPRSLLFHTAHEQMRLNFFPATDRMAPVHGMRAYASMDLARMRDGLADAVGQDRLSTETRQKIEAIVNEIYDTPDVLALPDYASQITVTNDRLWERFFSRCAVRLPQLLYLDQEQIVERLLIRNHLHADTSLHALLFDPTIRAQALRSFDGMPGAFSMGEGRGTFLFWSVPTGSRQRVALWPRGDRLESNDGAVTIPLDPAVIQERLTRGELVPSTLLSLLTLSCYYGVKCLSGFSQTTYLTRFDQAYAQLFGNIAPTDHFTKGLCGDMVIGLLSRGAAPAVPATGLDFVLYHQPDTWQRFSNMLDALTVRDAFAPMLPELYRILHPVSERESDLDAVTAEQLVAPLLESGTIRPCLSL